MSVTRTATTRELASFLARLRYDDLPEEAIERTKELFLDWVGSALAGKNVRPVRALERFADEMGPPGGPDEVLTSRRRTSPLFAALVNGAASHVVEQDDLHNASVFHPATVVFPAALAAAQQTGASGREVLAAAADGLLAAYLARDGFTGAQRILEGKRGMAAGMSPDADPRKLVEGLGEKWAVLETSFKFHAACRHTHPAADALLEGMEENGLTASDIARVRARVHGAAIDVLGPVTDPRTVHQSKFSMGFVLALIAERGSAGIRDFTEEALGDPGLRSFHDRVEMVLDPEVDAAYPGRWIGLVEIETTAGERITTRVDVPKGDPGNTLDREELEEKTHSLAAYASGASSEEMDRIIARAWRLEDEPNVRDLLPGGPA